MKHLAPFYMQEVKFDHCLRRTREYDLHGARKKWRRVPCTYHTGTVVGIRRLQDGYLHYMGEDGTAFEPKSSVLALLVVFSPWRNPVYVLPMDAQEITDGH